MNFKPRFLTPIKVLSTVLIIGAIALELWNLYEKSIYHPHPVSLNSIFLIERLALAVHFFEGITAAFYASSKGHFSIQYGVYTFFVGTVGLLELFAEGSD